MEAALLITRAVRPQCGVGLEWERLNSFSPNNTFFLLLSSLLSADEVHCEVVERTWAFSQGDTQELCGLGPYLFSCLSVVVIISILQSRKDQKHCRKQPTQCMAHGPAQ